MTHTPHILLIISGSIAAYKCTEVIRGLRDRGMTVTCILTKGGAQFITPLTVASLSEQPVYSELFSLKDETEMGHIRLSREADLVVVAPASADMLAKMAHGRADDLASTVLLATDKPVMVAPAMNVQMWQHPATQRNVSQLTQDNVTFIGPESGELACGETGAGRMSEPEQIIGSITDFFLQPHKGAEPKIDTRALHGKTVLVTAGPTYEAIDPVRFLGNRSSGKQGYAIAHALQMAGADVTLVSGPTALSAPHGVNIIHVESAAQMHDACMNTLPADIVVAAAAVSDWTVDSPADSKLKKRANHSAPQLELSETPDILHSIAHTTPRPELIIGFAAETASDRESLLALATDKRTRKGCDWLLANDVSNGKVFGQDATAIHCIRASGSESWDNASSKQEVAARLVQEITIYFSEGDTEVDREAAARAPSHLKAVP